MSAANPPILVVDDDAAILEVLGGQITLAGYEVDVSITPRDALVALQRTRYAAVISDYQMPEMSGLDLLARARELQPGATRMLVTGVLAIDAMMESIKTGLLHRFLTKPWARVELLAAVEAAVQHHRMLEENRRLQGETRRLSDALHAANAKVEVMLDQLSQRDSASGTASFPLREIDTAELRPGMRLARAVISPSGLPLLETGDELTPVAIDHLKALNSLPQDARRMLIYERLTVCG